MNAVIIDPFTKFTKFLKCVFLFITLIKLYASSLLKRSSWSILLPEEATEQGKGAEFGPTQVSSSMTHRTVLREYMPVKGHAGAWGCKDDSPHRYNHDYHFLIWHFSSNGHGQLAFKE